VGRHGGRAAKPLPGARWRNISMAVSSHRNCATAGTYFKQAGACELPVALLEGLPRVGLGLQSKEVCVAAVQRHQLLVAAALDDAPCSSTAI